MDLLKNKKLIVGAIVVLAVLYLFMNRRGGGEGFAPFYHPPMGSMRGKTPHGLSKYPTPKDYPQKHVPMHVRTNYDRPNTDTKGVIYGSIGPFYDINGIKVENPDIERLKILDQTCNNNPDLPALHETQAKLEGLDNPFGSPQLENAETHARFYPTMEPNGLSSEVRNANLYARDVMPEGHGRPVYYNPNNVMRIGDSIKAQMPEPRVYISPRTHPKYNM